MDFWLKVIIAVVLGMMLWRLWPAAKHQLDHGPKGTSKDWQAAILPIGAVVLFIVFLVMMVRN